MINILVVDDEVNIRNAVKEYAVTLNYAVTTIGDGYSALELMQSQHFDIVILDLMMPFLDGFSTCKKIKEMQNIPVIFLSAKTSEEDKLQGFEIGADDYVTKPFSIKELLARVKVVLERYSVDSNDTFTFDKLSIDFKAHQLKIDGKKINLTPKEYDLLEYLVVNRNIALERGKILEEIWGYAYEKDERTVDTHIKMLRNSLNEYRYLIVTVRLTGYKFEN